MELNRPFFKEPGSCGCHRAAQHDGAAFARSGEGLDVWHLKNLKTEQEKDKSNGLSSCVIFHIRRY